MKHPTIVKSLLVVAVLGASLAACSRGHDVPKPASPRPMTRPITRPAAEQRDVITAQLVLHARPIPISPGWM